MATRNGTLETIRSQEPQVLTYLRPGNDNLQGPAGSDRPRYRHYRIDEYQRYDNSPGKNFTTPSPRYADWRHRLCAGDANRVL